MEEIINKLDDINILLSAIDDDEKILVEQEILDDLTKINTIINIIYSKISILKLSQEKCNKIIKQNKKNNLISKCLFPYYWILNECITNFPNNYSSLSINNNTHQIN